MARLLAMLLLLLTVLAPEARAAEAAVRTLNPAELPVVFGVVGAEHPEGKGLIVTRLARFSPAELAGVRPTDVLLTVAGVPVPTRADLMLALQGHQAGESIPVTLLRGGREKQLRVTLTARRDVMAAKPRPVAPISAEALTTIRELQGRMARELARELPDRRALLDMGAQIRSLMGGRPDEGSTTLRYDDAQGTLTLTVTPDRIELSAHGKTYTLSEAEPALPSALRERLREQQP